MRVGIYVVAACFLLMGLQRVLVFVGSLAEGTGVMGRANIMGFWGVLSLVAMAGAPIGAGIALLLMAMRYRPEQTTPSRLLGKALLIIGSAAAIGSFLVMLPYFVGASCNVALIVAPVFVLGLAVCVVGMVVLAKASRRPMSEP